MSALIAPKEFRHPKGQSQNRDKKPKPQTALLRYGPDSDDAVGQIDMLNVALAAARCGARPPTITSMTGIKETIARKLYSDVHGRPPARGQMPSDPGFFMNNPQVHIESLWLLQTYRGLSVPGESSLEQAKCMLLTYELYQQKFPEPSLHFDRFYFLVRSAIYGKQHTIERCPSCDGPYLSLSAKAFSRELLCPVCAPPPPNKSKK